MCLRRYCFVKEKKVKILSNKRNKIIMMYVSKVYALLTRMLYHCIKFLLTVSWDDLKEIKYKVTYEACNIFVVYFFTNPQNLPGLKAFYNLNRLWAWSMKIFTQIKNKEFHSLEQIVSSRLSRSCTLLNSTVPHPKTLKQCMASRMSSVWMKSTQNFGTSLLLSKN